MIVPKQIRGKMPCCGGQPVRFPLMRVATEVGYRTCASCGQRWVVVIKPLVVKPGLMAHELTWTKMA